MWAHAPRAAQWAAGVCVRVLLCVYCSVFVSLYLDFSVDETMAGLQGTCVIKGP